MTISQAIARLTQLHAKHGDIEVYADCPACGVSFVCGLVVTAPETVRLRDAVDPHADSSTGTPTPREKNSSS